ncbi:9679_t:CDS:1, partial [Funneliformis mosseae]
KRKNKTPIKLKLKPITQVNRPDPLIVETVEKQYPELSFLPDSGENIEFYRVDNGIPCP